MSKDDCLVYQRFDYPGLNPCSIRNPKDLLFMWFFFWFCIAILYLFQNKVNVGCLLFVFVFISNIKKIE